MAVSARPLEENLEPVQLQQLAESRAQSKTDWDQVGQVVLTNALRHLPHRQRTDRPLRNVARGVLALPLSVANSLRYHPNSAEGGTAARRQAEPGRRQVEAAGIADL